MAMILISCPDFIGWYGATIPNFRLVLYRFRRHWQSNQRWKLEAVANRKRVAGFTLRSFSSSMRYASSNLFKITTYTTAYFLESLATCGTMSIKGEHEKNDICVTKPLKGMYICLRSIQLAKKIIL